MFFKKFDFDPDPERILLRNYLKSRIWKYSFRIQHCTKTPVHPHLCSSAKSHSWGTRPRFSQPCFPTPLEYLNKLEDINKALKVQVFLRHIFVYPCGRLEEIQTENLKLRVENQKLGRRVETIRTDNQTILHLEGVGHTPIQRRSQKEISDEIFFCSQRLITKWRKANLL